MLRALLALVFAFAVSAPLAAAQDGPVRAPADWYYIANNQTQGGYTLREMEGLTTRGIIRPATQVHSPAAGWRFAKDTPELQPFLADAAPAGAPPAPPPPVRSTVQADLNRAMSDHLIGAWRATHREEMAGRLFETVVETQFRADGSYAGFMTTSMPDSPDLPPLTDQMSGRWSVNALDAATFVLTLDLANGLPPEQIALSVVDERTMTTTDGKTRYERVR